VTAMCERCIASRGTELKILTPPSLFWETLAFVYYSASQPALSKRALLHDASPLAARTSIAQYMAYLEAVFGQNQLQKLPTSTLRRYLAVGMHHFSHLEVGNAHIKVPVGTTYKEYSWKKPPSAVQEFCRDLDSFKHAMLDANALLQDVRDQEAWTV